MAGSVLVVGATSSIGRALVAELSRRDHAVILAGRNLQELERLASDTRLRHGVAASVELYDASTVGAGVSLARRVEVVAEDGIAGLVLCHGYMSENVEGSSQAEAIDAMIRINYGSAVELLEAFTPLLVTEPNSFVCGVGSVAGDRGRASNALYGSSKGALALYLGGLRARLARQNVRVLTVKPGFVDSRMTWGQPRLFWVAEPERVARDILRALDRDRPVVYTPSFWRVLMMIIRSIPDSVFRRMSL